MSLDLDLIRADLKRSEHDAHARLRTLNFHVPALLKAVEERPARYLGTTEVAARIGVTSLSGYKLPPPDVQIGTRFKGWLPETIDEWNESRPGPGYWGPHGR